MCGPTKAIGRGLGDVFTLGLGETNLGGGIFKKARNKVGNVLTLGTGGLGEGGGGPSGPAPVAGMTYDPSADRSRLEALFSPIRTNAYAAIDQAAGDQNTKIAANQAARGILRSGISEYPRAELAKSVVTAKGGVESDLAKILGGTESQRSLFQTQAAYDSQKQADEYNRKLELAKSIADANKKSTLEQVFEGVTAFSPLLLGALGPGGFAAGALQKLLAGGGKDGYDPSRLAMLLGGGGGRTATGGGGGGDRSLDIDGWNFPSGRRSYGI